MGRIKVYLNLTNFRNEEYENKNFLGELLHKFLFNYR